MALRVVLDRLAAQRTKQRGLSPLPTIGPGCCQPFRSIVSYRCQGTITVIIGPQLCWVLVDPLRLIAVSERRGDQGQQKGTWRSSRRGPPRQAASQGPPIRCARVADVYSPPSGKMSSLNMQFATVGVVDGRMPPPAAPPSTSKAGAGSPGRVG